MKGKNDVWVHVNRQGEDSMILYTDKHGILMLNHSKDNHIEKINEVNMIHVFGNKNYISKCIADWLISISNEVISSNLTEKGGEYEVTNTMIPHNIQLCGNGLISNLETLNNNMIDLLNHNDNSNMIIISGGDEYVIEDEYGKAIINKNIVDVDRCGNENHKNYKNLNY